MLIIHFKGYGELLNRKYDPVDPVVSIQRDSTRVRWKFPKIAL